MASTERVFQRQDGITAIRPVKAFKKTMPTEPLSTPSIVLPFQKKKRPLFTVRDSIAVFDDDERNLISGILIFEIRPNSWSLVYCHTAKLRGYETLQLDNGEKKGYVDFLDLPFEIIHSNMERYVHTMMEACDTKLLKTHYPKVVRSINATLNKLNQCTSKDFTVDIYIPPAICELTGERYIRPGGKYQSVFGNPAYDIDFEAPQGLTSLLNKIIKTEIPAHGLKTLFDFEVETLSRFGGQYPKDEKGATDDSEPSDDGSQHILPCERRRISGHNRHLAFRR